MQQQVTGSSVDTSLRSNGGQRSSLVVVSCGKAKIWDRMPDAGDVPARDAYTSSLFKLCRRYAEVLAEDQWVILSAKYGFLNPTEMISNYNKAFGKDPDSISAADLRKQWHQKHPHVRRVISLGSRAYSERLMASLPPAVQVETPLAKLNLFQRTAWLKSAASTTRHDTLNM